MIDRGLLVKIVSRAWEDKAFKSMLITDPVHAIQKYIDSAFTIDAGTTLSVIDRPDIDPLYEVESLIKHSEHEILICIPKKIAANDMELSEDCLEGIVGGTESGGLGRFIKDWLGGE